MVYCCVVGCHNTKDRNKDLRFFVIPAIIKNQCERTKQLSTERRRLWLTRIYRKDLENNYSNKNKTVCDRHFISGRPSKLFDNLNPDWAPSVSLGHQNFKIQASAIDRYLRLKQRQKKTKENHVGQKESISGKEDGRLKESIPNFENEILVKDANACDKNSVFEEHKTNIGCMTSLSGEDLKNINKKLESTCEDNRNLRSECQELRSRLNYSIINEKTLERDDDKVKFFTGLPNFTVLKAIFELVTEDIVPSLHYALSQFQELIIVLMRLRLNLLEQDLAYRFCVNQSTISRILSRWLPVMADKLRCFIAWPDRDTLHTSMPQAFINSFGSNVCVIIDCFEIFIDRVSSLMPRAATWSQYKHHNTVKLLIGITPQGSVSFISKGWAGRTSDKEITENCGILDYLIKGDIVLADRGFNIEDDVAFRYAQLAMPASTQGKPQLSFEDVESSRKIANLRIHVERVIGLSHIAKYTSCRNSYG